MKIIKANVSNFGSYKQLSFYYSNQGLCLLSGPTGSGKSTLQDIPCWILFGNTAKNGSVDDVRNWESLLEPTKGILYVEINTKVTIAITRIRGTSSENDLYWQENGEPEKFRGKDIKETQVLLEKRLGINQTLYLLSAYATEFSGQNSFFITTAKNRRILLEEIAPLELPAKVQEASKEQLKIKKKQLESLLNEENLITHKISSAIEQKQETIEEQEKWNTNHIEYLSQLHKKCNNFEADKTLRFNKLKAKYEQYEKETADKLLKLESKCNALAKELEGSKTIGEEIQALKAKIDNFTSTVCPACNQENTGESLIANKLKYQDLQNKVNQFGRLTEELTRYIAQYDELNHSVNPHLASIESIDDQVNEYQSIYDKESKAENPFDSAVNSCDAKLRTLKHSLKGKQQETNNVRSDIILFERLNDLSFTLRGALLTQSVKNVETSVNSHLELVFESPMRVVFNLQEDEIEVTLLKGETKCNYKQLSKGQRSMLRLCFNVAIMELASNKAGVHFDNIFMDESLDGLDADLKIKAFSLFEKLALNASTVMVIDHSEELKSMFSKVYEVELDNGQSRIKYE